ncbi:MAG: bifunctional glutamate N-acetyltransferase/amino-acid acetyltransferase ArgJ [Chromatiales bacterium]|nr:bifunctional glutamate N-acetyltransferase/amino-acid acetyltransferase ArgJ [Chromatiales bacterium]
MPVGLTPPSSLAPVTGVRIATAALGGRGKPRDDLTLFEIVPGAACAATFTRNAFCAAPVTVAREHLAREAPRYLLVNAGNANAGTGVQGIADAKRCCALVAEATGAPAGSVLPFSTGVIGEPLPVERFERAVPAAVERLSEDGWLDAASAIATTDIVPKGAFRTADLGGRTAVVTGIAKGSGMIRPDMATMLAFIATDAAVAPAALRSMVRDAVEASFNRITVDGDTSTNDACVLVATGALGNAPVGEGSPEYAALAEAVGDVARELAHAIVRDGEGATKFVTVEVEEGADGDECLDVAYTVAHSPLVKTALYASDANWGRILAAVGRAGLADLDLSRIRIRLNGVCIVSGGERDAAYTEEAGAEAVSREEIEIRIALGRGEARDRVWTCDFSHQYVTINAEYRT